MTRFFISFLAYIVASISMTLAHAEEKLIFSLDLIRHGDRTPIASLPASPYTWNEGLGELTTQGKAQARQLGAQYRQFYIDQLHFLPQRFDANLVYVRSTSSHRTIATAKAVLSALYPHETITIDVIPKQVDYLRFVKPQQILVSYIQHYFSDRDEWEKKSKGYQPKLPSWAEASGIPLATEHEFIQFADHLNVRKLHHVAYPKGISRQDAENIIHLGEELQTSRYRSKPFSSQTGNAIIGVIKTYVKLVKQRKTKLKYVLFVTHDSTIMSVMTALGKPLAQPPPYLADINFSLFQNDEAYKVVIRYNGAIV